MTLAEKAIFALSVASALGSGLIAGTFFVFSVAVMPALARLPAIAGASAMQSINLVIVNPIFLGVFLGTGLLCASLAIFSLFEWQGPRSYLLLAGSLIYILGSIFVTMNFNVPLNNTLASLAPGDSMTQEFWTKYVADWTLCNHIRTAASFLASAAFIFAARN